MNDGEIEVVSQCSVKNLKLEIDLNTLGYMRAQMTLAVSSVTELDYHLSFRKMYPSGVSSVVDGAASTHLSATFRSALTMNYRSEKSSEIDNLN